MYSSSVGVIHAGQKYTISSPSGRGMSVHYKSVFRFSISRTVLEKWAKKSDNRKIWANFDLPANFFGGSPQNFETFWILVLRAYSHNKFGPRTPTLVFNIGGLGPPNFNGGSPPKFSTQFLKLHLYPTI